MATKKKESKENIEEVKVEEQIAIPEPEKVDKKAFISRKLKVINMMSDSAKKKYLAERLMMNRKEI